MLDLAQQRYAADRSAHFHVLATMRVEQGWFGAALFYQGQAARWHQRAVQFRDEYNRIELFNRIPPRDNRPCYSPQQKAPCHVDAGTI